MIWMFIPETVASKGDNAIYFKPSGGDIDKVKLVDESVDIGFGPIRSVNYFKCGRHVHVEHLPKRLQPTLRKKTGLPDCFSTHLAQVVSDRLRELIEKQDPGVHQFVPVEVPWSANEGEGPKYFWFIPGYRLFAMDKSLTQPPLSEKTGFFNIGTETDSWKPVFMSTAVGDRSLFCTAEMSGYIYVHERLKNLIEEAGMIGVRFMGPYQLV